MRRRLASLLAVLLLAAACGNDTTDDVQGPTGGSTAGPAPTQGDGGGDGGSSGTQPPGSSSTASGSDRVDRGAGGDEGRPSGGSSTIAAQPVGRLAPFLLRPGHGNRIVVEVRAQDGAEPRRATVDHVVQVLREASGKTVAVDGVTRIAGAGREWTSAALRELADAEATTPQGGDQTVIRLLFLRGTFEGDRGVLGVAVRGDVAAVFSERIEAAAGLLADPAQLEDAATVHEVGHLLGLVDLFLATGRADPDHPGHSGNSGSVMYWAVESDAVTQILGGRVPNQFDADDKADLAAIRRG